MSAVGTSVRASVIVPTHNRDSTLDLAIASIQAQTVRAIEIVIAGDGVTPAVRAVAERLAAQDSRIRFLDYDKAPGRGYENRHRALLASVGEYIFYSDDDDLWLPDHVEKLSRALSAADVADSAVVSIARSGRMHRAFANHAYPAQRQLLAASGLRKMVFDTHLAHRRSLYMRLGSPWVGGVADLLSGFAASDAIWATFNGPTALSLHGSVRHQDTPSQRRAEASDIFARLSTSDIANQASGVWYLYRMLRITPPRQDEILRSYFERIGVADGGVSDGQITVGDAIAPKMADDALVDMEMAFNLFLGDVQENAPLHRILLPLAEPLLAGAPHIRQLARALCKVLPGRQAQLAVSQIPAEQPPDMELKALLRAQVLLNRHKYHKALPILERGSKTFAFYGADAALILAHQARRDGRTEDGIRVLRLADERFGGRTDVRLTLATKLWQWGRVGEATELCGRMLEANPRSERATALLAKIRERRSP